MSIFDVPELASLIGSYLSTRTLLSCVRVNKAWHSLFMPTLWESIPPTHPADASSHSKSALASVRFWRRVWIMVCEDYLNATQRLHQLQLPKEQQTDEPYIPGALSKNGYWMRHLNIHQVFLNRFPPEPYNSHPNRPGQPPPRRPQLRVCNNSARYTPLAAASPPLRIQPSRIGGTLSTAGQVVPTHGQDARTSTVTYSQPAQPEPTEQDLLLHLLRQCTQLQSLRFDGHEVGKKDVACWEQVMMTSSDGSGGILRNLKDLEIDLYSHNSFGESPIAALVFGRCPRGLRKLRFHVSSNTPVPPRNLQPGFVVQAKGPQGNQKVWEQEQGLLPELKELSVICNLKDTYPTFWSQFLSRCANLTSLHVTSIDRRWIYQLQSCTHLDSLRIEQVNDTDLRLLTDAFKTGTLPNVHSIHVDTYGAGLPTGADTEIAEMLKASSTTRWRSVHLLGVEALAIEVLLEHCLTLEHLSLRRCRGLTSAHVRQFLASCPRLVTFCTLEDDVYEFSERSHITVKDFIDQDVSSSSSDPTDSPLRPWQCESTLKVFRAKVTGIPRPEVAKLYYMGPIPERNVLTEAYPGQSLDLQRRVYERLARFTNLELLELGNNGFTYNYPHLHTTSVAGMTNHPLEGGTGSDRENEGFHDYQNHCLAMNLKSGLELLAGLKRLKEVRLIRMLTDIRKKDVRWMVRHWPRLEVLGGLNAEIGGLSVQIWIEKTYPALKSTLVSLPLT